MELGKELVGMVVWRRFRHLRRRPTLGTFPGGGNTSACRPELFGDHVSICLAKLRPDGFVSLDADNAGTVFTKPFMWHGENLFVNVNAAWGEFYASIVDAETLRVVPEFDLETQRPSPLKGDHWKARIQWNADRDLVFDKPVRLRFFMHQARFYSSWLE